MNVSKLEEFLKQLCLKNGGYELELEFNDHKSCFGTVQQHEISYPIIPYNWVNESQRHLAYETDDMWKLDMWSVPDGNYDNMKFASSCAHDVGVLLAHYEGEDPAIGEQAKALEAVFRKLLKGEYTHASIRCLNKQWFHYAGKPWEFNNVTQMLDAENGDENYNNPEDWVSLGSMEAAKANDFFWRVVWYPNTPGGFNDLFAATLQELFDELLEYLTL